MLGFGQVLGYRKDCCPSKSSSFGWGVSVGEAYEQMSRKQNVKSNMIYTEDIYTVWASLVTQLVKNLPAMWKTWFRSLGWEDPLEEGMVAHSIILAWRIPWTEEPGRLQSMGSQRVGQDWMTKHSTAHTHTPYTYNIAYYMYINIC